MIRIGFAGLMHPGIDAVLPQERSAGFDRVAFFGDRFGCLEIDTTAHVIPRTSHVQRWRAALSESPRTRLLLRLPGSLLDRSRSEAERAADAATFLEALRPLLGRDRLGAVVATLPGDSYLYGASEVRGLSQLARALAPAPLVLDARHRSWYEAAALDAVRGTGWSLGYQLGDDRWDAPPADHAPTGRVGMLRLVHGARAEPPLIGATARMARALESRFDVLYVVAECGPEAYGGLPASLEIKFVLGGERPVPAWDEVRAAFPHLAAVTGE
ncbi:MAG: DUF72 domain-containing protein [Planctomycetota bacterium]